MLIDWLNLGIKWLNDWFIEKLIVRTNNIKWVILINVNIACIIYELIDWLTFDFGWEILIGWTIKSHY